MIKLMFNIAFAVITLYFLVKYVRRSCRVSDIKFTETGFIIDDCTISWSEVLFIHLSFSYAYSPFPMEIAKHALPDLKNTPDNKKTLLIFTTLRKSPFIIDLPNMYEKEADKILTVIREHKCPIDQWKGPWQFRIWN